MPSQLKYMPIFRLRQEEKKVLLSYDFGKQIFPCVEIIKEKERVSKKLKSKPNHEKAKKAKEKTFEEIYLPILAKIKSDHVFLDLPVHMSQRGKLKPEVLNFLRTVVDKRDVRTDYINKLAPLASKIIPVISTYYQKNNEIGSIKKQENDLRKLFKILAFRTFSNSFTNDLKQIEEIAKPNDYLIVDLEESFADLEDEDVIHPILEKLKNFKKCSVVIARNVVSNSIKNTTISHGDIVAQIDNRLIKNFPEMYSVAFGDYAGIKKDGVTEGGGISPGFIIYDPIEENYYGYKGNRHIGTNGKPTGKLSDFETIIVPDVLSSTSIDKLKKSRLDYLGPENKGWEILNNIHRKLESGQNQAKFKRISMEHYIHCVKTQLDAQKL